MQFNTYTLAGAHIAVWLVNHPAGEAAALAAELDRREVHGPLATTGDAAALRPWAVRLRAVFEAPVAADKARLIDALLVAADCRPRLVSHGAGKPFHFHYAPVETGLAARVLALTAAGLGHVVDGGAGDRLRACDRPGCGVAFSTPRATAVVISAPSAAPTRSTWPTTGSAAGRLGSARPRRVRAGRRGRAERRAG